MHSQKGMSMMLVVVLVGVLVVLGALYFTNTDSPASVTEQANDVNLEASVAGSTEVPVSDVQIETVPAVQ